MASQIRTWGPAAAWAAVLFLLSASSLDGVSLWFALNDKLVHLALYTVLGAALAGGWVYGGKLFPHWVMILVGWAYGATDEWHQSFVPRRSPSVGDWVADIIGVLIGYAALLVILYLLEQKSAVETEQPTG